MAVEASEESCFDRDFEFDAPQWIDLGSERDQLENETNRCNFCIDCSSSTCSKQLVIYIIFG